MGRYKKDASNLFNGFFKKPGVKIIRKEDSNNIADETISIYYLDKIFVDSYTNIANILNNRNFWIL